MKRKDNLTDVVERLPTNETTNKPSSSGNQEVTNSSGDVITLGHIARERRDYNTHPKLFELTVREAEKIIKATIDEEMKDFAEKITKKVEMKLKERGLM